MKKISTPYIASIKILFPVLWFGIVGGAILVLWSNGVAAKDPSALFIPVMMLLGGIFFMRVYAAPLADEVYDCGDHLLVRKDRQEERVPLADIINVNANLAVKPARITLTLARPGRFGAEVSFAPPPQFNLSPFARSGIADELIARINAARTRTRD